MRTKESEYDELWNKWHGTIGLGPSQRSKNRVLMRLISKYVGKNPLSILDFGCGDGLNLHNVQMLLQNRHRLHGTDVSPRALASAKALVPQAEFRNGCAENKELYPQNAFDLIFSADVLEHLEHIDAALESITTWLNPEGYFIFTIPADQQYWSQQDDYAKHVQRYSLQEMDALLIRHSMSRIEAFYWGGILYKHYYMQYLAKTPPEEIYEKCGKVKAALKKAASSALYHLFRIEDFYRPTTAPRLFAVYRLV